MSHENEKTQPIWRNTKADGQLPFSNFTHMHIE